MSLLKIDENLCKRDGLCVKECPSRIIKLKDAQSIPETVPGANLTCLRCGHCVAVCPHGALSHVEIPIASCPDIDPNMAVSREQAVQFVRSRRSVRVFKKKPVEKDILADLIKVASYAPTGSNLQLVEWTVYSDKKKIVHLSELVVDWMRHTLSENPKVAPPYMPRLISAWEAGHDLILRNAPAVVVAMVPKTARNGMVDTSIALSYFDLVAPTFGLGTCWAGLLQGAMLFSPPVKEAMGISADYPFHYPMMVGYNQARYYRLPERKNPTITWR
jgi:nitroreductase/NAD-dependent dihydropyrimidine dehydrogenase PreA subunit